MDRDTPVREIMTTDVLTIGPGDKVEDAMRLMVDRNVDAVPVIDPSGRLLGMLSNSDLIVQESELHFPTVLSFLSATIEIGHKHFEEDLRKALGSKVSDVMTAKPVTITGDETIERAATLMHEKDVSRLPVVTDGKLVGLVSRNDVLRAILASR
jgi:CBS domain-containing protein